MDKKDLKNISRKLPSLDNLFNDLQKDAINKRKKIPFANTLLNDPETLKIFNLAPITMDIDLKKFELEQSIKSIESRIADKEKARNMKMQTDFEKERNYLIDQQKAIKLQIEAISNEKNNEIVIQSIKEEINSQQDIFNRLYSFNSDLISKINKLKLYQKETTEKIENKRNTLKSLFVENINLMEKIKNQKNLDKSIEIIKDNNVLVTDNQLPEEKGVYSNVSNKNNLGTDNIVNIATLIEENVYLKEKYNFVRKLKANANLLKNEVDKSILKVGDINKENMNLCKVFTEGLSEISKEILKIHEVQKIQIPTRNLSRNNLYYGLIKERTQHCRSQSENYHMHTISQAKSINTIKEKYKNNIFENIDPHYVIYNVITNLFKENRHLYQKHQIKRKKLDWIEFEQLNSYQIFALLYMNEGSTKTLESTLFPKTLKVQPSSQLFLTGTTEN